LVAALGNPSADSPDGLQTLVVDALDSIREEEERERERLREEAWESGLEARLAELTTELGLAPYQVDEMRVVFTSERTRRDELFTRARESGEWWSVRDSMRELRGETMDELANVLSADQLEKYQESGGGFGRGPGGPGGGPGGFGSRRGGDDGPGSD